MFPEWQATLHKTYLLVQNSLQSLSEQGTFQGRRKFSLTYSGVRTRRLPPSGFFFPGRSKSSAIVSSISSLQKQLCQPWSQATSLLWGPWLAAHVPHCREKNDSWITIPPSSGEGVASLAFSELRKFSNIAREFWPGYAQELMQYERNGFVSHKRRMWWNNIFLFDR